ncbi:MAG TPA: type II toxin-antitoxin system VapB family antitoxin [Rhizomicrobium sp.]|nr:type II toxin-antitoxin system VapB family antitoxin [Rhizomicrobium sp.]
MRVTVDLDDDLVATARAFTGIEEISALIHAALKELIATEAARRLARMGGSDPKVKVPPRRRPRFR